MPFSIYRPGRVWVSSTNFMEGLLLMYLYTLFILRDTLSTPEQRQLNSFPHVSPVSSKDIQSEGPVVPIDAAYSDEFEAI